MTLRESPVFQQRLNGEGASRVAVAKMFELSLEFTADFLFLGAFDNFIVRPGFD
jgi:hypothetical protein